LTDMKMEKSQMYHALKRGSAEYEKWFLKYTPKSLNTKQPVEQAEPTQEKAEPTLKQAEPTLKQAQTLVLTQPQQQPQSRTKKYKRRAEPETTYIIPMSSFRKRLFTKRRNIIQ